MCLNQPSEKIEIKNQIFLLLLLLLGLIYVCCHAFIEKFTENIPVVCFSRRFFNLYCPFCGISRSCACFLKLDFNNCLTYNPLVVFFIPFIFYISFNEILKFIGSKFVLCIPGFIEDFFVYTFMFCVFIVGIVRIFTFVYPPIKPYGFLIPPP